MTAPPSPSSSSSSDSDSDSDLPPAAFKEGDNLASLCPYCNLREPVYTCPRCRARTCSVACSKRHKVFRQCNGVRDATAYVKKSKLITPESIDRDYNFLTSLDHQIFAPVEKRKEEEQTARLREPLRKKEKERVEGEEGGEEGGEADEEIPDENVVARKAWVLQMTMRNLMRNAGVSWERAPWRGFQRAKENRTCHASRKRTLLWTIEWLLLPVPASPSPSMNPDTSFSKVLWPPNTETQRLLDHLAPDACYVRHIFFHGGKRPWTKAEMSQTCFYISLPSPGTARHCVRLDANISLRENLRGRTVLEFPTIVVHRLGVGDKEPGVGSRLPDGWEVVRDNRKIQVLGSSSGGSGSASKKAAGESAGGPEDVRATLKRRIGEIKQEEARLRRKLTASTSKRIEGTRRGEDVKKRKEGNDVVTKKDDATKEEDARKEGEGEEGEGEEGEGEEAATRDEDMSKEDDDALPLPQLAPPSPAGEQDESPDSAKAGEVTAATVPADTTETSLLSSAEPAVAEERKRQENGGGDDDRHTPDCAAPVAEQSIV